MPTRLVTNAYSCILKIPYLLERYSIPEIFANSDMMLNMKNSASIGELMINLISYLYGYM